MEITHVFTWWKSRAVRHWLKSSIQGTKSQLYIFFNFIRWQYCAGLSEQKAKRSASVYSEIMQLFK